ncbi:MAG: ANTAR domain-containing protein, partial [Lysobacteraceae bacterium]
LQLGHDMRVLAREIGQQHWRHLIDSQQACLQVFVEFSDPQAVLANLSSQDPHVMAELERLRRVGCAPGRLNPELAQAWFDCCTTRIDDMRIVEEQLAANLRRLCGRRIEQARSELRDQQAILETLAREASQAEPAHYGPHLERSVVGMVQDQTRRLQAMSDELDTVRATLNERKVIERAKGLLMAHRQLTEEEAYKTLRQTAMNQNKRVIDVAEAVLAMADVLPARRP